MQTFIPYSNIEMIVKCLDKKRLGCQRKEANQIYNILTGKYFSKAWSQHPAVLMWKGYENALLVYYNACLKEWECRGCRNIILQPVHVPQHEMPWWRGGQIHASHRAMLLKKNFEWYSQFGWTDTGDYYWPVKQYMKN